MKSSSCWQEKKRDSRDLDNSARRWRVARAEILFIESTIRSTEMHSALDNGTPVDPEECSDVIFRSVTLVHLRIGRFMCL